MERPPIFTLDVVSDRALLNDVLKGVLCTIFFHRFFTSFRPKTRDFLDLTLPAFDDPSLDASIDAHVASLLNSIDAQGQRGQLAVQFFERRTKKPGWFAPKAEEKVCWEQWVLNVTLLHPRTDAERAKARRQIEDQLQAAVLNIIKLAGNEKNHVPPIMTNDSNPFPYTIVISPKGDTWGTRMGIF